jgi:DNA polymerase III subunit delta'
MAAVTSRPVPGAEPAATRHWVTRGQPGAIAAVAAMITGPTPHAVLLAGPPAVGKTTLALDLAAGLLCTAADPAARPCRACRSCRLVAAGNHPDVHRLAPEGPGDQVVIGDAREAHAARGVRDLLRELALLPVEGGARVAIIQGAVRMNEDAQNALLKTLEEPPPGVTIVLCVDREEVLLPTVRSRCARVRLGPVGPREIEGLLADLGLADAATAARLARLAEGRPGVAVAYARAPEAVTIRDELTRTLLDLLAAGRARRLAAAKDLLGRARDLADALAEPVAAPGSAGVSRPVADEDDGESAGPARLAPAERRRAARQLLAIWRDLARDLAVARLAAVDDVAARRSVHDTELLEELGTGAARLSDGSLASFLARLDRIAEQIAGNANPELAIDVALLAWPHVDSAAA